jgi:hypothetical protein
MSMSAAGVRKEVDRINRNAEAEFWRNPDRPATNFFRSRDRQDPEIVKAKSRERTKAWRVNRDRKGRPEVRDIGVALLASLVTTPHAEMSRKEWGMVARALADL